MTWNDVRKQSLYKLWRKVEERRINFALIANSLFSFLWHFNLYWYTNKSVIKMLGSKQLPGKASFPECACAMQRGKSSKLRHSRRSRETVLILCENDQITENRNLINIRTGPCACEATIYIARNRVVCFLSSGKLISFEQKHLCLKSIVPSNFIGNSNLFNVPCSKPRYRFPSKFPS